MPENAPPRGMRLRVLTLNVWNTEGPPDRQQRMRDGIRGLNPDLIALQEVVKTSDHDQLDNLLGGTGLHLVHDTDLVRGATWGTAVAARWAPKHIEAQRLAADGPGPTAIAAVVPLPIGTELLFLGVKPSYKFTDEAARCRQAAEISTLERRLRQAAPTIMAGDFDAEPGNECMRFYTGRAPLDGQSVHFRDPPAPWPERRPGAHLDQRQRLGRGHCGQRVDPVPHRRRIDYILGRLLLEDHPDVLSTVTSCRVVLDSDPAPSDHYGVLADLELVTLR